MVERRCFTRMATSESSPNQPCNWKTFTQSTQFMENYWYKCQDVALSVISVIEMGLKVPNGTIQSLCQPAASEVRLNHYPAIHSREIFDGSTARIWPHTDFGIITLLLTDDVGGLEFEESHNSGKFLPVPQGAKNELIINVADTLERWTNGALKAGMHRVMQPVSTTLGEQTLIQERWSVPYLFKARRDALVGALPEFVTPHVPSAYDSITALEFQLRRQHQVYSDTQLAVA
jgi:isopenicillin N synthase-like dioxygenase